MNTPLKSNSASQNISNGLNIAGMMKGATSGKSGGQRIMQILPAILEML